MKKILIVSTYLVLPIFAFAQFREVDTFFTNIMTFINNILIPLIFALALLLFIYGMFKYFILGGGSDADREQGKQLILWAIIGFVMMVSIWGIVNMFAGGLFPDKNPPTMPKGLSR